MDWWPSCVTSKHMQMVHWISDRRCGLIDCLFEILNWNEFYLNQVWFQFWITSQSHRLEFLSSLSKVKHVCGVHDLTKLTIWFVSIQKTNAPMTVKLSWVLIHNSNYFFSLFMKCHLSNFFIYSLCCPKRSEPFLP